MNDIMPGKTIEKLSRWHRCTLSVQELLISPFADTGISETQARRVCSLAGLAMMSGVDSLRYQHTEIFGLMRNRSDGFTDLHVADPEAQSPQSSQQRKA
jgi:hypothetical protein